MSLKNLDLKIKYTSYDNDLIKDFYNPVLLKSILYNRAVGYFSSSALLGYVKGIRQFIKNDGKLNLIMSPVLTNEDFNAITKRNEIEEKTKEMFDKFMDNEIVFKSSQILFLLLKKDILSIKIAEPKNNIGIFHDKIGVFYDSDNNYLAISGSNNETITAIKYNTESFHTFNSWNIYSKDYAKSHNDTFYQYWNNKVNHINFIDIEDLLDAEYIDKFSTNDDIDELYKAIFDEDENKSKRGLELDFEPWENQLEASNKWYENKKGILEMATGTGKTKTAIYIYDRLLKEQNKLFTIVVVPDITLLNQWYDELSKYNKNILKTYSSEKNWHIEFKNKINKYRFKDNEYPIIVSTNQTFQTSRFQEELRKLKGDYFLIVDEMHNWGTINIMNNKPNYKYILGLSATPELHFKDDLNKVLFDYFGGIVYKYNLEMAIKDGVLVPYFYHPIIINLTDIEKENYINLSHRIARLIGGEDEFENIQNNPQAEQLLFRRSRIIYGATNKMTKFNKLINQIEEKGRLVVYSGITSEKEVEMNLTEEEANNQTFLKQIDNVADILNKKGIRFARYTSNETEIERLSSIKAFSNDTYSTLLAIKCLDEGVDIPSIERAIILASSTNPREFVQRRGRILRKSARTNKTFAEVYDFIVLENDLDTFNSLNKNELARFYEFSKIALNKNELEKQYDKFIKKYTRSDISG